MLLSFAVVLLVFQFSLLSHNVVTALPHPRNTVIWHSQDPRRNDEQLHSGLKIQRQTTLPLEFIYPRFSQSSTSKALTKVANSLEKGAKMSHRAAKQAKKLKSNTKLSQFGAKPAKMAKNAHKSLNRTGNVLYKTAQVFRAMANLFQKGGGKNAGMKRRDQ